MPRGKQTKGMCAYCGQEIGKGQVTKHLATCPQWQAVLGQAERQAGAIETLYHLRVHDAYIKDFWLDLEMRGSRSLKTLDSYLRAIWLECCGHLSEFTFAGWGTDKIAMTRKAEQIFQPDMQLTHIYDFGTSSETLVKVVGRREGKPTTKHPIALLARNVMPEAPCLECDQPAAWLCMECMIEHDATGLLCDEHVKDHPHENYGEPTPLVNSLRLGMCGYNGPAEPP